LAFDVLVSAGFHVIAADNFLYLASGATAVIDKNLLVLFEGAHRRLTLQNLAARRTGIGTSQNQ